MASSIRLYHTAGPNEVMIITGGRGTTITREDGTKQHVGYRMKIGGGALIVPWLESVSILPLDVFTVQLKVEHAYTANSIKLSMEGQAQVKVRGNEDSIHRAAEHFLGRGGDAIRDVAGDVIEGYIRAVVGRRSVEDVISAQEAMSTEVLESAMVDLEHMGLVVLSFSFKQITDEEGFITALAEPRIAEVRRDAVVARSEAEKDTLIKTALMKQEGDVVKLRSEEEVMSATSKFEKQRALQQADVNEERARADIAYDLERYKLSQELKQQEAEVLLVEKRKAIEIQEQEIIRRTKELEASVKRPADAHDYQARLEAEQVAYRKELEGKGKAAWIRVQGEAEAATIEAQGNAEAKAMASKAASYRLYNQAALAEMFVKVLPEMARAIAKPLEQVEKIVMVDGGDGAGGISKLTGPIASAVAQVPAVMESLTGVDLGRLLGGEQPDKLLPRKEPAEADEESSD